jgi:hypothetical protein
LVTFIDSRGSLFLQSSQSSFIGLTYLTTMLERRFRSIWTA